MKKLLRYMKPYRVHAVAGPLIKWIEALFELLVPLVVAKLIDEGIPAGQASGNNGKAVWLCAILAILGLVGFGCSLTAQYFSAKAATGFAGRLRRAMFDHTAKLSYAGLDRIGSATIISRLTGDLAQVQTGVNMFLRLFLRSPFVVFGAMVMALTVDTSAAIVFVGAIPLLFIAVAVIMKLTVPGYRDVQKHSDELYHITGENITGVRVIRAFGMESEETDRFRREADVLAKFQITVNRVSALMNPVTFLLINGAMILLIYSGAVRVNAGGLSQGEIIALVNYMSQILVELIKLANLIITVSKGIAAAGRISEFLDTPVEAEDLPVATPTEIDDPDIAVRFENVSFTYPGAASPSIENISFILPKGKTLGIIGPTGSGKTTLVNLIPRFYDADEGRVTVGGRDVRTIPLRELRDSIGIAEQRSRIFSGTVRENLAMGKAISDDALMQALETAQARDFIMQKDGGLDHRLTRGGKNLSGGQRQRLNIARALADSPDVLILDDSSSALDYATDAALREALARLAGMSVIIISQRAAGVRELDQILVMDDGEAVGLGTFDELLESCPVFAEICRSQGIEGGAL